ncbi:MAG: aminoacetone oxidase family FAD-binding enzyme [Candidatus Niyogibacteria bacterium CG10_big_fil_rev_8_21_14_0_10_42_19]|uniref:Aminoacetone oxidase family FAD-binding enzyme n=1 Tax=Candidatus Niyogibacteria bacterium CG10_big_fil_rev_8_21_14_0_10_42_19 TaxID=1974725 RepID=A0A2H0TEV9_9BACT|nr:MAG: aminoacetone oxidase family FAD-binding enzyme [Candidatus Niyogibacteria bacterium CG10_big_fil_rev_8_21_14_0_10_42_19]
MTPIKTKFDLIVVGGGASGLMAAGRAADLGKRVLLLEKNKKVGEKLKMTGGGRCNITNAEFDTKVLLKTYGEAEKFLYSLFSQFGVKETFSFFESKGLPLVVQARKRAFPKTEKAEDVLRVLLKYARDGKVTILTDLPVTKIHGTKEGITGVSSGKEMYSATDYLFATGSVSHPETGSTGDGLKWLEKLGHSVFPATPTIVPISTAEKWSKTLAGVSLSFMKITFFSDGKKAFSITGKILFTHFGLSGPLILNNAHRVANLLHDGIVTASIDAYPHTDLGALDRRIVAVFNKNKNKEFRNIIKDITPEGTGRGILPLFKENFDINKKVHSIGKDERKYIVRTLKALPLTITGLMGFDRAVVADGGVTLKEIDMRTMRSKIIPNLYVTGDLLHINRPSGGFSLQLCWSSGYVAGSHAGK